MTVSTPTGRTHRRRMRTPSALIAGAALVLAGCGGESEGAGDQDGAAEMISFTFERNTAGAEEDPAYESTTVEVPKKPERILTFDMASLDTIGALGGKVSGAPLESVPEYLKDNLATNAVNIGTLFEADLVAIEAFNPDLIIVGGRSAGLYKDLSGIAPTVDLGLQGGFVETLERNTTFLGEVLDAKDEAAEQVAALKGRIDEAASAAKDAGSGLGIMVSGGKVSALAPSSGKDARAARGGLIYDVFGVQPAVEDVEAATHGEPVSFEFLLEHNPDYLWVVDRDAATAAEGAQSAATVLDNAIVKQTTAANSDQIVYLNPVAWYVVAGGLETTQLMVDDVMKAVA